MRIEHFTSFNSCSFNSSLWCEIWTSFAARELETMLQKNSDFIFHVRRENNNTFLLRSRFRFDLFFFHFDSADFISFNLFLRHISCLTVKTSVSFLFSFVWFSLGSKAPLFFIELVTPSHINRCEEREKNKLNDFFCRCSGIHVIWRHMQLQMNSCFEDWLSWKQT